MENIISTLQSIFMGKDNCTKVGLNCFREEEKPVTEPVIKKKNKPQELKLSELMRKGSC